jgi:hypothetical protein
VCYDVTVKRERLVDSRRNANKVLLRRGTVDGRTWRPGLAELERRGLIRPAVGDLLDVTPVRMPKGRRLPSHLIREDRGG